MIERRRPRAGAPFLGKSGARLIFVAAAPAVLFGWLDLAACVRHADIRDEPDGSNIGIGPELDAGDIPELDSGLGTDAFPACSERPLGDCYGTLDFPCGFEGWAIKLAEGCFKLTGCKANGWVEVKMGSDGCVQSLGMDQPNDSIAACMLAELGTVQCPCMGGEIKHFFGLGNTGPCPAE